MTRRVARRLLLVVTTLAALLQPLPAEAVGACTDPAFSTYSVKWSEPFEWRFNAGSTPSEVKTDRAESALRAAATNLTHAHNSCGLPDQVSFKVAYQGRGAVSTNITSAGGCSARDGVSAVGFGKLPVGVLALACWWASSGHTIEADVRFNKAEYRWVVNIGDACADKYSVEAVATHEFGHVAGLGHVDESAHGTLTMSTHIEGPCQTSETSLGLGDVLGLETKY